MKSLILITGNAGAGKSTIAKYIEDKFHYKDFALGDNVKTLTYKLLTLFKIPINSVDDLYDIKTKPKYRSYLQQIGTECMRGTFGDDFWCEQLDKEIRNEDYAIVSDVRFISEYNYFKSHYNNVHTIKVIRNGIQIMKHQSEQEINTIPADFELYNNGSILDSTLIAYNIMNTINGKF